MGPIPLRGAGGRGVFRFPALKSDDLDGELAAVTTLLELRPPAPLLFQGTGMTLLDTLRAAHRPLALSGENIWVVDAIASVILASQWRDLDPVWVMLVAPASTGKTELVQPYLQHEAVVAVDTLTENTLISGWGMNTEDEDPSLLPLLDGKTLIAKEFSCAVNMESSRAAAVHSELRSAYDGQHTKAFGLGIRRYQSKFNFIACAVPRVDSALARITDLGDRFLRLRLYHPSDTRRTRARHARRMARSKATWRKSIADSVSRALDLAFKAYRTPPMLTVTPQSEDYLDDICDLSTRARFTPNDDRNAEPIYEPEGPERLGQQLLTLMMARAALDGRSDCSDDDLYFAARFATDTLPPCGWRILAYLSACQSPPSIPTLSRDTHSPPGVILSTLRQYGATGLVYEINGNPSRWSLCAEFLPILHSLTG